MRVIMITMQEIPAEYRPAILNGWQYQCSCGRGWVTQTMAEQCPVCVQAKATTIYYVPR